MTTTASALRALAGVLLTESGWTIFQSCVLHHGRASGLTATKGAEGEFTDCEFTHHAGTAVLVGEKAQPRFERCHVRENRGVSRWSKISAYAAQISRTQLAAAFGNVIAVCIGGVIFEYIWKAIFHGFYLSPSSAEHAYHGMNPLESGTAIFAAFTGVILWIGGLVGGWAENFVVFNRIPEALIQHPLGYRVGVRNMRRAADWLERNVAAWSNSIVLGYLLGPAMKKEKDTEFWVGLGPVDQFPEGETRLVNFRNPSTTPWDGQTADLPCWVRRISGNTFQVFAINCAHLGCPVRWFAQSKLFMCPCHGGAYYEDGSRASGPPERGLFEYAYKIEANNLIISVGDLPTLARPGTKQVAGCSQPAPATAAASPLVQIDAARPGAGVDERGGSQWQA